EKGAVVEKTFYDPFGGRVDAAGKPLNIDPDPSTTLGYTSQEEDGRGLINMRGRIYDRMQYRFITPDPVVANPLFGQSYNPYSYALNSPLRYTDPTGYQSAEDRPADSTWKTIYEPYTLTCTTETGDGACGATPEPNKSEVTKAPIRTDSDSGTPAVSSGTPT